MTMEEALISCKKCGKMVPANDMRMAGKDFWVCNRCFERETIFSKAIEDIKTEKEPHFKDPRKKEYMCGSCGFSFEKVDFKEEQMCPYCGEKGTVRLRKLSF